MEVAGRVVETVDRNLESESYASDEDLESSPLLSTSRREPTPLPIVQLLIIGLVRLAEPISFTQVRSIGIGHHIESQLTTKFGTWQIFPYVNQVLERPAAGLHRTECIMKTPLHRSR